MKEGMTSICRLLALTAVFLPSLAVGQSGTLVGSVVDLVSGEALPGATVAVSGTALGAATDLNGEFWLRGVPSGEQQITFSYVGYSAEDTLITLDPGGTFRLEVGLRSAVVEGDEVVITAQLEGQQKAINAQLSSNTIVNVVSAERIQELPDRNAAEALQRLPGIAVERNAGEGQKVIIRGLAPKFNSITVNGERIPSTDPNDRSVDLSMISPEMLAGIEVFKSLTPDKDADAIGGTVNFIVANAKSDWNGNFRLQSGYADHVGGIKNFKTNGGVGNRFLNNRLGVLLTANLEKADRSSDVLDGSYSFQRSQSEGVEVGIHRAENLNLVHRLETRYRGGGSLTADYKINNGSLLLSSFFGRTERDELRRRRRYRLGSAYTEYDYRQRDVSISLWTNSLSGKHNLPAAEFTWRTSYSRTSSDAPREFNGRFRELAAFRGDLIDTQGPELIQDGAKNDLDATWFKETGFDSTKVNDRDFTAQADLRFPVKLGNSLAGYIKTGLKHRDKARDRDVSRLWSDHFGINQIGIAYRDDPDSFYRDFELDVARRILISNFTATTDTIGAEFLDGRLDFGPTLDMDELLRFAETFEDGFIPDPFVELDIYEASEAISAAYVMTELNFGPKVMLLPGIRYEYAKTSYTSVFGRPGGSDDGQGTIVGRTDTTGGQSYGEWLPMVHFRVKPTDWFDVRLAATRTLSRPDYFNLVPYESLDFFSSSVERGNPELRHATAWNYDAYFSFYNKWGLFTVGGFYKNVWDIDYIRSSRITEGSLNGFTLTAPENSIGKSTLIGVEFDVQTNLSWLPNPLDGIVLFMNYTLIDSETPYPFFKVGPRSPDPPFLPTFIDTVRVGKMPGQADYLANVAIGYEKGGFSGRVSVVFQGKSLQFVGTREELDGFSKSFARWDLSLQQRLVGGLSLFGSVNNITNRSEGAFLSNKLLPTREEFFGWSADLGVRFSF
jgi:TonB-dependent receptor